MHNVTVHQAKTNLSSLLQEALRGEIVTIARGKVPIARLVPLKSARIGRKIGSAPNLVKHMDKNFNKPMPEFSEYI